MRELHKNPECSTTFVGLQFLLCCFIFIESWKNMVKLINEDISQSALLLCRFPSIFVHEYIDYFCSMLGNEDDALAQGK